MAEEAPRPVAVVPRRPGSRAVRVLHGHPRSLASLLLGLAAYLVLLPWLADPTRAVVAWNVAAMLFIVLSTILFIRTRPADMPQLAERAQEGQWSVFWFTLLGVTFSLAAVFGELGAAKDATPAERLWRILLVVATLLLSWLVLQVAFAYRYAHGYYERVPDEHDPGGRIRAGLDFPGDDEPDYWDFFYFSAVLGMTFQVSDVQIKTRQVRRFATAHGFLGFVFNTVIVALTVNLASGLL